MNSAATTAVAPARVNIIGEHTDHNDGLVLPTCTALFTRVTARARDDRCVSATSAMFDEEKSFDLDNLQPGHSKHWTEYIKGVAAGLLDAGAPLQGVDLEISGDIPTGAGLSSSASLELAVAHALLGVCDHDVDAAELALICQRAEHQFAGVQCGIMDQYALACARLGSALFLDCRTLQTRQVSLPKELGFLLTDSGLRHNLTDGNYNKRADECVAAVKILADPNPVVTSLRDVDAPMLARYRSDLGETLYRRCRHVLTENQRVLDMVSALEATDLPEVGALLTACHESLRDDFETSCEPVDSLVAAANQSDAVLGSRMVGGGFGGCVLSACHTDHIAEAAADIRRAYNAANGKEPWQHQVVPADPAHVLEGQ